MEIINNMCARLEAKKGGLEVRFEELEALRSLTEAEVIETRFDYDCIATLILTACGRETFFRVLDDLQKNMNAAAFRAFIDYEGNLENASNPLDTGEFTLSETFDVIDRYYGGRYCLIYFISSYQEFETLAHYIIGNDKKGGIKAILDALGDRTYTKEQFDVERLQDIWEEYYEEEEPADPQSLTSPTLS